MTCKGHNAGVESSARVVEVNAAPVTLADAEFLVFRNFDRYTSMHVRQYAVHGLDCTRPDWTRMGASSSARHLNGAACGTNSGTPL